MNTINIYKYAVKDGVPVPFDIKSTTNPLIAEKRYLRRCVERTDDEVVLVIDSNHPEVPNANFSLQKGELSHFERESDTFRRYCLWTIPERCWIDLGKQWQPPTCYQMKALRECILQENGGEVSTADLAKKFNYHKRTFSHYFSESSDRPTPFVIFQALQRLANFPIDEIKVTPPLKRVTNA